MRASKRPLAILCPSSDAPASHTVEVAKEASDVGRIAHAGIASAILGEEHAEGTLPEQCRMAGVDMEEVEPLTDRAMSYWGRIYEDGYIRTQLLVETPYTHPGALGGTPDARWLQPGEEASAFVLDWKFGRERRDCYHQLAQYAYDYREELRANDLWQEGMTVTTIARWVRLGQEERRVFSSHELDSWMLYAMSREQECGEVYNPGDHCGFCPHAATCAPRLEWSRSACQSLVAVDGEGLAEVELLGKLHDQAKAVRRALAAYDKALGAVLDNGGTVPLPDGRVLVRSFEGRDDIDLRAAWGVMRDAGITSSDLSAIAKVSKTKLGDAIKAKAPRGQKKAQFDTFMEALRDAGAVGTKYVRKTNVVDGTNINAEIKGDF